MMAAASIMGIQAVAAQPAQAAACIAFDNLRSWSATAFRGTSASPTYTTTRNCRDINFGWAETSTSQAPIGNVRVCFVRAGTCNTWKRYNGDTAALEIVIASNVSDGTTYRVEFLWNESVYGSRFGFRAYA
jgi:hypothetical protein